MWRPDPLTVKMIKTTVCGVSGRMGILIARLIAENKNFSLVGAVEKIDHPELGKKIEGIGIICDLAEVIGESDVVIEFTTPSATLKHLAICGKKNVPVVIGTTGFSQEEIGEIRTISEKIPVLLSPNMSLGVNLLFKLVKEAATILKDYEVEIVETHHNKKKDAPSGTAKKIAEIIGDAPIHSLRFGNVVGEHRVIFAGKSERLELFHRAEDRETFARGALKAAAFIVNQQPGLYSMENLLNDGI